MYTEGEPKEKMRKLNSPPPSHPSPGQHSVTHGSEAPPQPSPEVLPPASAAHSPTITSSPPPYQSACPPVSSTTDRASASPLSMKLQQQGNSEQLRHLQQQQQLQQQQHLQHHKQRYDDAENLGGQQDKGQNSDSDSSSAHGSADANRRFREFVPDEQKDNLYWEKRRKNNEAARKSREKRRMHDMVLEGRITCLEDDNSNLRRELGALKRKFKIPDGQSYSESPIQMKDSAGSRVVSVSPPAAPHHSQPSVHSSSVGSVGVSKAATRSHMPYSSPPPLLGVAGAVPMGMAMYPGGTNPNLPYFLSEASRLNQETSVKGTSSMTANDHHHHHHHHHHHQPISSQHLHHPAYSLDLLKHEPIEEGEVRVRERSNSSVERRPNYHIESSETSMLRRGSVGNYAQYRSPLSPSSAQINRHPNSHINQANHSQFLQRGYDNCSQSAWSQRSPVSSHSSDDNYDEPLQLTVRRDSTISTQSNHHIDDNSMDSEPVSAPNEKPPISFSPPASSFPLKLRHKIPSHDAVYHKEIFPTMTPSAVSVTQPSFPTHPFMNGLAHLSDMALSQTSPLSLMKSDSPAPYSRRSDGRSASRRNPGDTKYMDPKYLERRRRNNEAARKCRENRKTLTKLREAKSDYLENENNKLRDELTSLQEEMKQLRELIEKKRLEQGIKEEPNAES